MKAKLASMLMLISFVQRVASQNPCHPNCSPYGCHGPTEFNCDVCSGNSVLDIDTCVCKPGWFSVSGRCDTYVPNCKEIQISGGVVSCLSCISVRDTFDGTSCTRSNPIFFLRSTTLTYTASAQDKTDANFFVANQCLSVGPTGKCEQCYSGGSVNGAGACVYIATTCGNFDLAGTCTKARTYYYLQTSSPLTTEMCFGACKTCVDGRFGSCLSCPRFFYFKLNSDSNLLGNCYLCHPSCDRCVGPLITDCTSVQNAFYIDRVNAATMNQVLSCPAGCSMCNSPTDCLWCDSGKISVDGICSGLSNTITGCLYQTRTTSPLKDTCLKFTAAYITATDHKGYTMNTNTAVSKCSEFRFFQGDRVTLECMSCAATYLLKNGLCLTTSCSLITNCWLRTELTTTSCICLSCSTGFVLSRSKTSCGSSCAVGETIVEEQGISVCTPCPARCSQCIFQDSKLKCVVCEPSYALYKDSCMSQVCGDGIITLNKECDPMLTPTTCTSDCLLRSISECPNDTDCSRQIFQLTSVSANRLAFKVTQRFSDKVDFSFNPNIMYDTTDPAAQQFFCGRIFTLISDPSAICTFNPTASIAYFDVSRSTMASLVGQTSTIINTAAITVSRKYISQLAFTISPTAAVSVSIDHVSVSFLITTAPVAAAHQDLQLTYELLDPAVTVESITHLVTSVTLNGVDQPQVVADLNAALGTTPHMLPGSLLTQEYIIGISSTLKPQSASILPSVHSSVSLSAATATVRLVAPSSRLLRPVRGLSVELHYELLGTGVFDAGKAVVRTAGVVVAPGEVGFRFLVEVRVLIISIKFSDALADEFTFEFVYDGGLPDQVHVKRKQDTIQPSVLVPAILGVSQPIRFWISQGAEVQYSIRCYSKSSNSLHISTAFVPSDYSISLTDSIPSTGPIEMFLIVTRQTLRRIFKFEIVVQATAASNFDQNWELPVNSMYFDGSVLHISDKELRWGFPRTDWVTSLALPPTASVEIYSETSKNSVTMGLCHSGNQINTDISPKTAVSSNPISAQLDLSYTSRLSAFRPVKSYTSIYTSSVATLTVSNVASPVASQIILDISLVTSTHGSSPDPQQIESILYFKDPTPLLSPVLVPISLRDTITLHSYIGPSVEILCVFSDSNRYSKSLPQTQTLPADTDTAAFIDWMRTEIAALPTQQDKLRSLAILTLHINRATAKCLSDALCKTTPAADSLHTVRWEILAEFKTFWTTAVNDPAYQNSRSLLTKSVVVNGLSAVATGVTDPDISWIDFEVQRETNKFFSFVQTQRNKYGRFTFELVETLKPLQSLTLLNLDQHTSAVAHALQLYVSGFKSFTSADDCSLALNTLYKHLLGLNEVRLIRYTLVSAPSSYENEMVTIAGLTLTEPLTGSNIIWAGDKVAVEVKNLKFEPALDSYELSVIVFQDTFSDSLKGLLQKFNLTSSLDQSRTSVSFTNRFELVYPKIQPDTEINIYRSPEECRGTPCNLNRQLTSGSTTIILCECLVQSSGGIATSPQTPPPAPKPEPGPLNNVTEQVGQVIKNFQNQTKSGVKCLFGEPDSCITNKKNWLNSITFIFGIMSILCILACVLESKIITPNACYSFATTKVTFALDQMLREQPPQTQNPSKLVIAEENVFSGTPNSETASTSSKSSADTQESFFRALPAEQRARAEQLIACLPKSSNPNAAVANIPLRAMTRTERFLQVAGLSHSIVAIWKSQSKLHSRKTSIFLFYLRSVYELAFSMFFTIGLGSETTDYFLKFALRCLLSMAIVWALIPIIKKLVRSDSYFNMSAIFCFPKIPDQPKTKLNQETMSAEPTTPASTAPVQSVKVPFRTRNRNRSQLGRQTSLSIQKVSPANSSIVADRGRKGSDVFDSLPDKTASLQALSSVQTPAKQDVAPKPTSSVGASSSSSEPVKLSKLAYIYLGYAVMYGFLLGCIIIIVSVSQANDESGNWPWGWWYLVQFGVSSTLGSVPSIMMQWGFLITRTNYLKQKKLKPDTKEPCLAKPHFLFNSDIYDLPLLLELPEPLLDLPEPANERRPGEDL